MATPEEKRPGPSLVARMEERFFAPFKRDPFAARTWFLVTVAVVLALHAGLIAYLLYWDGHEPVHETKLAETPVEVVVEPPKPPAKPPLPKAPQPPKPQAKQEMEKPASSAPRAPSEEKIDTQRLDKETHAPQAPTPPQERQPAPSQEAASPTIEPAKPDTTKEEAARKDVLDKDAEALDKATPQPPKRPEKVAKSAPPVRTHREKTALQRLAGRSALPDYAFARPSKKAPITGGNEDNRYLSNVFAKIMVNFRPVEPWPVDAGDVTVAFDVDDDGTILTLTIAQSSGDQGVDAAAVAAVSRASPLPPLPPGSPHGLIARIGADSERLGAERRDHW